MHHNTPRPKRLIQSLAIGTFTFGALIFSSAAAFAAPTATDGDGGGLPPGGNVPLGDIVDLGPFQEFSDGLAWYLLILCVAGMLISAAAWAMGSKGQNPSTELNGKKGFIVCLVVSFMCGAVGPTINWLQKEATFIDDAGVTVTVPYQAPVTVPLGSAPFAAALTSAGGEVSAYGECNVKNWGTLKLINLKIQIVDQGGKVFGTYTHDLPSGTALKESYTLKARVPTKTKVRSQVTCVGTDQSGATPPSQTNMTSSQYFTTP